MKKILSLLILAASLKPANAQHWTFKWALPKIHLNSMHFLNTEVGYIAGNWAYEYQRPSNGVIFKTIDGGQTFTQQYGGLGPPPPTAALRDIHFFNESQGIAVGDSGLVLNTFNGGVTWKKARGVLNKFNYGKAFLLDYRRGYMIGADASGGSSLLFESKDRERWIVKSLGNDISSYVNIYFLSSNIGFVSAVNNLGAGRLYKTINAGVTWELASDITFLLGELSFPTPLVGFAGAYGGRNHFIAKTVDGGLNWSALDSTVVWDNIWYRSIVFLTENVGYAIRNNEIIMTQDGGQTWSVSQSFNYQLFSLSFPSSSIGYVLMGNRDDLLYQESIDVYKTINGGGLILKGKNKQILNNPLQKKNY